MFRWHRWEISKIFLSRSLHQCEWEELGILFESLSRCWFICRHVQSWKFLIGFRINQTTEERKKKSSLQSFRALRSPWMWQFCLVSFSIDAHFYDIFLLSFKLKIEIISSLLIMRLNRLAKLNSTEWLRIQSKLCDDVREIYWNNYGRNYFLCSQTQMIRPEAINGTLKFTSEQTSKHSSTVKKLIFDFWNFFEWISRWKRILRWNKI